MSAKDPRLYLIHIRECCGRILDYTGGIESTWPSVPWSMMQFAATWKSSAKPRAGSMMRFV